MIIQDRYIPNFFDEEKANKWYSPDIAAAFQEGLEFGRTHNLKPAYRLVDEGRGHMLVLTDLTNDFRERGRLPVPGTDEVVRKLCRRIVRGTIEDYWADFTVITEAHPFPHVSFDCRWWNEKGEPLNLAKHGRAAMLNLVDEKEGLFKAEAFDASSKPYLIGLYRPRFNETHLITRYWQHLQNTNQGSIWVFVPHSVIGTDGTNLHPFLAETIAFACGARDIRAFYFSKGFALNTDSFGPIACCEDLSADNTQNFFKRLIMPVFEEYATIEFGGVAEDFCNLATEQQYLKAAAKLLPEEAKKFRFILDGTAAIVPGAKHVVDHYEAAKQVGVKLVNHDEPFEH